MSKHTLGPWMVELNNPLSPIPGHTVKVGEYPHRGICIVPKGGGTHGVPTQEANAALIAAAPDLLALVVDALEGCDPKDWNPRARAAIAKATPTTPSAIAAGLAAEAHKTP